MGCGLRRTCFSARSDTTTPLGRSATNLKRPLSSRPGDRGQRRAASGAGMRLRRTGQWACVAHVRCSAEVASGGRGSGRAGVVTIAAGSQPQRGQVLERDDVLDQRWHGHAVHEALLQALQHGLAVVQVPKLAHRLSSRRVNAPNTANYARRLVPRPPCRPHRPAAAESDGSRSTPRAALRVHPTAPRACELNASQRDVKGAPRPSSPSCTSPDTTTVTPRPSPRRRHRRRAGADTLWPGAHGRAQRRRTGPPSETS